MNDAPERMRVLRIVTGGQTGVDRAALDVALELGIEHGGWCPRGRKAEDGRIADRYRLQETESPKYAARTEQNVVDSEGTLVLAWGKPVGGTDLTLGMARKHRRPCLVIDLAETREVDQVQAWLARENVAVLNIAGPRESTAPGVYAAAVDFLRKMLGRGEG